MKKTIKIFCLTGSILLFVMGVFHGSGILLITTEVTNSNAPQFIKDIFPVLFLNVSIHLLALAFMGIACTFLSEGARIILVFITGLVLVNVAFAFYLNAVVPGVLLLLAAACFGIATFTSFSQSTKPSPEVFSS